MGADSKAVCSWPGRLDLDVDDKGGTFKLEARLDEGESIALPGSDENWPLDVKVDGTPGVVLSSGGPRVAVGHGPHTVTGRFTWATIPSSLRIPAEIGLLRSLRVRGAAVASPNRDKDGVSLVSASAEESPSTPATTTAVDQVDVRVVRLLVTERPLRLDTWIRLKVSGKARELLLGPALPSGFAAVALTGKWPARIEPDGRIRVRASAGEEDIAIVARATATPTELARPAITATWTTGDEVWAFVDKDPFQMNSVEGPPRVPKSSLGTFSIPRSFGVEEGNCFAMKDGAQLRLVAKPRLVAAAKDDLQLSRVFSIASDGSGISVSDTISGTFGQPTRLEFGPPLIAGEAGVGSQRQVLGSVDGRPAGFEVPASNETVFANSWLPRVPWTFPVDAFGRTYQKRDVTFLVQAGWVPLYLSGNTVGLLGAIAPGDLILVALVVALMFAAHGFRPALLACATLLLGLLFPTLPILPFLAVAVMGWVATRAPEKRKPLALFVHRALVVVAALSMLKSTQTSLLLAFEPESVRLEEVAEEEPQDGTYQDKSGGTGTKHKGAEGMMVDPSKNMTGPIAFDSDQGVVAKAKADTEKKKSKEFELRARSFDPNSLPQFGPGGPRNAWMTVSMQVPDGQRSIRAIWLPPLATACLFLLRILLSVVLVVALLRFRPKGLAAPANPLSTPAAAAAVVLLAVLVSFSPTAHAQVPDHATLEDLKTRLATAPACRPNCTQIARVALEARKKSLVLRMEVHAGEAVALALPTGFEINDVLVDRHPADLVRAEPNLFARIESGIHEVTVDGTLTDDTTSLAFGSLTPHVVQPLLEGWTLEGLRADGSVEAVLTLKSETPGAPAPVAPTKAPDLGKGALTVMVSVQRHLDFDIEWKVRTTVSRLPSSAPDVPDDKAAAPPVATAEIALLPGESIVSEGAAPLVPHDGKVTVTLDGTKEVSWTSSLAFRPEVQLVAPAARDRFESWSYTSSSRWRVTHAGLRPLPDSGRVTFAPWPGETVTITLVRPTGLPGATARVDSSEVTSTEQGQVLALELTALLTPALGWSLDLPEGYEIDPAFMQPDWTLEGRTLKVKHSRVSLKLRRPRRALDAILSVSPPIKVSAKGVSATTTVRTGDWILLASSSRSSQGGRLSGNLIGLSLAIVFAFLARLLGQDGRRTAIAAAAGLMITTNRSLFALAAMVTLFLLLEWRRRWTASRAPIAAAPPTEATTANAKTSKPVTGYTLVQLALGALGIAAIGGFTAVAVMQALYGEPMGSRVAGSAMTWFLDRHDGVLPGATLVTLPMFMYRLVMAAWLAAWAYLLRQILPWAWAAFSAGGALHPAASPSTKAEEPPAG